ncbi:MAG: hypothetical protein QS721_12420 [Candidatus Endonucleobacter sp. (ex Gigantidas childressi)]|nr:hypothetical protein [Candidatus Endonucleobacter sp. (ex Gigantidas childressi)]
MTSGMDGVSGNSSIKSMNQPNSSPVTSKQTGDLNGLKVSVEDAAATKGLKSGLVDGESKAKPTIKSIILRKVAKVKQDVTAKVKSTGTRIGRGAAKEIVHGLSVVKRFILNESFSKINSESFGKCSAGTQKKISLVRDSYNEKCDESKELKKEMVGLQKSGVSFKDQHSTSMSVIDKPSVAENAKTILILTMPDGADNIIIPAPSLRNGGTRQKEIEKFATNFKNSDDFKKYENDQERIAIIKEERSVLKSAMKNSKERMLKAFKKDLSGRSKEAGYVHSGQSTETSKRVHGDNKVLNENIKEARQELKSVEDEVISLDIRIVEIDENIENAKSNIRGGVDGEIADLSKQLKGTRKLLKSTLLDVDNKKAELKKVIASEIKKEKEKEVSEFKKLISYDRGSLTKRIWMNIGNKV